MASTSRVVASISEVRGIAQSGLGVYIESTKWMMVSNDDAA